MYKMLACILILALILGGTSSVGADQGRGGFMGFIAGCCFGIRPALAYNDGKEIHWREWVRILPYISIIFAIWDGVDGYKGKTSAEFSKMYGAMFY